MNETVQLIAKCFLYEIGAISDILNEYMRVISHIELEEGYNYDKI